MASRSKYGVLQQGVLSLAIILIGHLEQLGGISEGGQHSRRTPFLASWERWESVMHRCHANTNVFCDASYVTTRKTLFGCARPQLASLLILPREVHLCITGLLDRSLMVC
jgi:hypothetical protein